MVKDVRTLILIGIFGPVFSLYSFWSVADVIFEGYAKVNAGSKQIGYYIQRFEFDAKKKQFISTNYLKTDAAGGDITESLKAVSNDKFQPLSYQYTSKVGSILKSIDAKFKGRTMTFTVSDGKNPPSSFTKQLAEGTFLSTFLQYLMLQNGYQVGRKFVYSAISEEDAEVHNGEAFIKEEMDFKELKGFRVLNQFKGAQFISFVTPKGEVLGTVSPIQDISTELVANPAEATAGTLVSNKTLQLLFGTVPTGRNNSLAKNVVATPKVAAPAVAAPSTAVPAAPAPSTTPAPVPEQDKKTSQ